MGKGQSIREANAYYSVFLFLFVFVGVQGRRKAAVERQGEFEYAKRGIIDVHRGYLSFQKLLTIRFIKINCIL
jgi:hypothetical protein